MDLKSRIINDAKTEMPDPVASLDYVEGIDRGDYFLIDFYMVAVLSLDEASVANPFDLLLEREYVRFAGKNIIKPKKQNGLRGPQYLVNESIMVLTEINIHALSPS